MRRYQSPYNGKQFLLNTNTGEIHDLDKEQTQCQINEIKTEHISMQESYMACLIHARIFAVLNPNGCAYCMPKEHTN